MIRVAKNLCVFILVNLLAGAAGALARNVDLSTVPGRDSVQLTIYNSEDLTLVREIRFVSFKKGVNPLQFSWANTLIDPTSVHLKFLSHAGELLDTTFPHDKPQMLYWNVQSERDGEARIEISYFTSGIRWSADYTAIANPEETALRMESFVRVFNNSGEEYENAQVRLVAGVVNLVEKIAELAQIPMDRVGRLKREEKKKLERKTDWDRLYLAVQTRMSETIFLEAVKASEKIIYVSLRNFTGKPLNIKQKIVAELLNGGYSVTRDPDKAKFMLQAKVLKLGKSYLPSTESYLVNAGFGGPIGGVVGNPLDENMFFVMVTDLQIRERPREGETAAGLQQKTTGGNTGWKTYRTRIVNKANKADLEFDEARPKLEKGLARSISGIFRRD